MFCTKGGLAILFIHAVIGFEDQANNDQTKDDQGFVDQAKTQFLNDLSNACSLDNKIILKLDGVEIPCGYGITRDDIDKELAVHYTNDQQDMNYLLLMFTADYQDGDLLNPTLIDSFLFRKGYEGKNGLEIPESLKDTVMSLRFQKYKLMLMVDPFSLSTTHTMSDYHDFNTDTIRLWDLMSSAKMTTPVAMSEIKFVPRISTNQ